MKRAVHAKGRSGNRQAWPFSFHGAGGRCRERQPFADRAAGMTAEIPVWPGRINLPAPGPPALRANGRSAGAPAPGCACGGGALCPPLERCVCRKAPPAAPAGEGHPFPLWQHAPAAVQHACTKRPRVPVEHGAAFAMGFQKYFSAADCMAAHWASMSATSLNWVRQRSRFWPSRCVLK